MSHSLTEGMTDVGNRHDIEGCYTKEGIEEAKMDTLSADSVAVTRKATHCQHTGENEKDPTLVEWDGAADPGSPMNWSTRKKWLVTVAMGSITFTVTFASSVFSAATVSVANEFGIST